MELALADNGFSQAAVILRFKNIERCRQRAEVIQLNALFKALHNALREPARHAGQVALVHLLLRGEQAVGRLTVCGEQQQAFRILVKTAYRHAFQAPVHRRQQIHHCGLPGIPCRGENARGLVHHQVTLRPGVKRLPVHRDDLLLGYLCVTGKSGDSARADAPRPDHLLYLRSAPQPQRGEQLIKPYHVLP